MPQTTALKIGERFSLLSASINETDDLMEILKAQGENLLFCPDCYEKSNSLIPFRFRNCDPSKRVKHFFHWNPETGKHTKCDGSSPESQKHVNAKRAVFDDLQARKGVSDVRYEFPLIKDGVRHRRPDIVALYPNGATVAVEIQISRIYPEQLLQRIEDAKLHGIGSIEWYLYDKNYSIENRKICFNLGAKCFRLWFDGDDTKPRWELDTEIGSIIAKEREEEERRKHAEEKRMQFQEEHQRRIEESRKGTEKERIRLLNRKFYQHARKSGWTGELYAHPWGLEGVMIDIIWIESPNGEHKSRRNYGYPDRYPLKDLIAVSY